MKSGYFHLATMALAACVAMPGLTAPPPAPGAPVIADGVKRGVDAWEAGNYPKAVAEWRPLATAGDPDAQFNLAQAYRLGRGVPVDQAIARSWYLKAAMQEHVQAQANYGLLLFEKGERQAALPWLQKAAAKGDARAQYVVGTALFNGDPLPKDWVRAYAMMTRAAASGLPPAVTSLTEMDKYIPVGQRQQGTAMAAALARTAAVAPSPIPVARRAPTPVRRVPLPPSASAAPKAAAPQPPKPAVSIPAPVPAPAAVAKAGDWRIQIGAFSEPARARSLWDSLKQRVTTLGTMQPYLVKAGAVTKLQGGPLPTRAAADRACAAVKAARQDCFAVKS